MKSLLQAFFNLAGAWTAVLLTNLAGVGTWQSSSLPTGASNEEDFTSTTDGAHNGATKGKPHGEGTFHRSTGESYEGGWKDGRKHGQGTLTSTNGEVYEGEWKEDKMHGQGTYTHPDGDGYEGEWKEDKKHGQGTYTYLSGDVYEGEWKDGRTHGQGTFTRPNGDGYEGEWKEDKMHGQGTYTFSKGGVYEGEYNDGKRHGQGTYTHPDGDGYEGEWKEDKMHGQGTYTYSKGGVYKGQWKDDEYHGQGTLTFANGESYVGEYKDGKQHGQGKQFDAQGNVYQQGKWLEGVFIDDAEALARAPFLADKNSVSEALECPFCYDSLDDPMEFCPKDPKQSCNHAACKTCVSNFLSGKCDTCSQILVTAGSAPRVDMCPDCLEKDRHVCPVCRAVIAAVRKAGPTWRAVADGVQGQCQGKLPTGEDCEWTGNLEGHRQHRHDIDHAPVP